MVRNVEMKNLVKKYQTEKATIIKRKKHTVDFTIFAGLYIRHNINISINLDELTIDKTVFKIPDIRTIYATCNYTKGTNVCYLYVRLNTGRLLKMNINNLSEDDALKLNELFDYFIFSNEKDVNKIMSAEYIPLINETNTNYDFILDNYENKNIIQDEIIEKQNIQYILYEIIPKIYYQEYVKKKATLLYESKYLNNNYMDVWVDKEWLKGNARIRNIINSVFIVLIAALIFYMDTVGRTDPMKGVLALSIITALFCIGFIMEKKFY